MSYDRIFNFSAGPATLPEPVLESVRDNLLNFKGTGMSLMEMSHRSKSFEKVIRDAEAKTRSLLAVPENYEVLFLQGGATLQFGMLPLNLARRDQNVDVIHTGSWVKKAIADIKNVAQLNLVASSEDSNFSKIPQVTKDQFNPNSAYVHICSNNTIAGTRYETFPDTGGLPLVADMSSEIFSRQIDVSKFGVIFAGAQKNLGPAGLTLVIIRKDLVERAPKDLPQMLQYRTHAKGESLANTPPCFSIYVSGLVLDWIEAQGGVAAMEKRNEAKAKLLYNAIEGSDFYHSPIQSRDRSRMNVVFRVQPDSPKSEELEAKMVAEAKSAGLDGLKGHRSVGGLRASIYNAMPTEGVEALVQFMKAFEQKNG